MKTIEARAREYVDTLLNGQRASYMAMLEHGYIRGANAQRDIDINRAIEWLSANWRNYIDQDADGMIRFSGWKNDFEKAMKDEVSAER